MPTSKTLFPSDGYRLRLLPADWLHRCGWPFYFQHTNPRFYLEVKRLSGAHDVQPLQLEIKMADGQTFEETCDFTGMKDGDLKRIPLKELVVLVAGPVTITIVAPPRFISTTQFQTRRVPLYAFEMRSTESLWLAGGTIIVLLAGAGLGNLLQQDTVVERERIVETVVVTATQLTPATVPPPIPPPTPSMPIR